MLVVLLSVLALLAPLAGCRRPAEPPYSQDSAQAVLDSALRMVKDNRADLLTKLIYADSRESRIAMQRLGKLLGHLQEMGVLVSERFPEEASAIRKSMLAAAGGIQVGPGSIDVETDEPGDGEPAPAAAPAGAQPGPIAIPTDPASQRRQRRGVEDVAKRLFADPLSFITDNEKRLSVQRDSDDVFIVQLDGQALLGGLVRIERRGERWWLVLPLNLPVVQRYAPQTRNEWLIVGDVIAVMDNLVVDLTLEVREGKVQNLTHLSNRAGEMLFGPAALAIVAYVKEMAHRDAREKGMAELRPRLTAWSKGRAALGELPEVTRKLMDVVRRAAVEGLDRIVRQHLATTKDPGSKAPMPSFKEMTEAELVSKLQEWLADAGAPLPLGSALSAAEVEAAAEVLRKAPLAPAPKDPEPAGSR